MPAIERMTITMPAEMAAMVKATVAEGHYASTSEVVREALRDWARARNVERRELEVLRDAVRTNDDTGAQIPVEDIYAKLRYLVVARRTSQG